MEFYKTKLGKLYQENCLMFLDANPELKLDLVITSPPYNIGKDYDVYDDSKPLEIYYNFIEKTFRTIYNRLKPDGRVALNVLFEANFSKIGSARVFFASDIWNILKDIGYKWAGFVELDEPTAHRSCLTAWGSWMSPSSPYIYNPKECILIAYKDIWKKESKGISSLDKEGFIEYTSGQWKYRNETRKLTEAEFSLDIPLKALKILSWENDLVYDPFMGSGTTALACEMLKRRWLGTEISSGYCNKTKDRIKEYLRPEPFFHK